MIHMNHMVSWRTMVGAQHMVNHGVLKASPASPPQLPQVGVHQRVPVILGSAEDVEEPLGLVGFSGRFRGGLSWVTSATSLRQPWKMCLFCGRNHGFWGNYMLITPSYP